MTSEQLAEIRAFLEAQGFTFESMKFKEQYALVAEYPANGETFTAWDSESPLYVICLNYFITSRLGIYWPTLWPLIQNSPEFRNTEGNSTLMQMAEYAALAQAIAYHEALAAQES